LDISSGYAKASVDIEPVIRLVGDEVDIGIGCVAMDPYRWLS
jgi:hypothetical protein